MESFLVGFGFIAEPDYESMGQAFQQAFHTVCHMSKPHLQIAV